MEFDTAPAAALAGDELRRFLAATLSPDKASVDAAAAGLDALAADPRFPLAILAVAAGDGDQGMRVAAAAYLKNFTRRNLESSLSSSEHYKEFRDQLAQALLRVEPAIFRVLIEVFRQVVEKDFVKDNLWPELIPQLKLVIQSSNLVSPGQQPEWNTINALKVLQSVVRPFQYFLNPKVAKEPVPQQLEEIAAEILVPLQVTFHHFSDKVLSSPDGTNMEYEQLLLITCKCMNFTVRSYMPSRVKQILPSFCKDMFRILDSLNFNSLIEDGPTVRLKIAKRCLIIFCALVTRHRKHADNQMPHIVNCAIKISKQSIHLSKLDSLPNRIFSLAFDVISRVLETGPGWRLVSPHFSSLLDSAIFPALALNEKDIAEWEEDTDEYMQKNLPSELDDISGWTEDLFTARKSAINLLGVIALSKGPPVASAASKRKKGDKSKGKSERSSIGELLVIPFLSKFPIPSHGEDASSMAVRNYFGVLMAYGGLQDFLTEKKDLTITLIRNRILPLYSLDPCSPYLISTANWVIGQLAICLPEDMSTSIYQSLMKALKMEDVDDITCYPVCASASGAIAELIENSYAPPDWLVLLQVVVKRISTGDENESALLFKLLGTIVEGGQEKVLSHIPEIVSNIANTVMEHLPPVPDPWPQVVEQGFAALVAMVQAWESSAPDENKTHEKRVWQSGQSAIAQTISLLLQKAWLLQVDNMENIGSALPPPSCVNDASMLLEFVMSSVTCMEETASMKVFELVAIWADTIANWDSWEEMEDQGFFNAIKEAVNFHQRFDLDGFFLKMLPSQSEIGSQSSVIGRVSNFVTRAIAAYPSATWRACSCVHTVLHAPNFSLATQDARKTIAESFAQAAFSHFKSISDSPAGLWKPLLLAISSCYICYPDAIEQVLNKFDGNGFAIWTSALAQVSSSSFNPGLSSESEIKLAVLTLSTVINHLVSLSMGGTKVVQDCYVSLMESCIQLKEVEEDGDNDDDDGAEDLDDDDEEEDTEDDDEDSDDDDVREETEEEFLERYALAAAGESIEAIEEGDIDEETQDIELGSLDDVDIQQVVISLMQKHPALQAQTFPDSLVERITETFPEYQQFFQVHR
ncbi:uncharacterized protein LOC8086009 [Sorghum bicolor]|uniref:Importin N-terminal domain-containing protein n=2 Tax=Sorghum bicolor TaxID=4558 RepID=A0A1B6PU25_SORBI|nr:uncharacterized protein LOC8086009 [Sorghum bicolor]KXG29170.1 hypothetical protein SORBI_3005G222000 [Sorghum bicolor]|eukprot:XP_021316870.1 uncharacterized protein LOC8086009 [Sorghum bicolor]